jgi:hypothetical protein
MPSSARRPGAPAGNKNALKHGLYSRAFRSQELTEFSASDFSALLGQIGVIRLLVKRVYQLARSEDLDLRDNLAILRALTFAITSINRLVRTRAFLSSNNSGWEAAFHQALEDLTTQIEDGDYPSLAAPPSPSPTHAPAAAPPSAPPTVTSRTEPASAGSCVPG